MNELTNFDFEGAQIRALTIDEAPYFVGKDVAMVLGYSNPRDAIAKHVDDEDRNTVAIRDGKGNPNQTIINESGLYSLILGSKLPDAKRFKRWVTSEVLPAIRKHGANRKKSLTRAAHFLGAIFALSALTMAGLIDGEQITGEPCNIWLFMATFVIAVISYIGSMALSDMAQRG